MSVPRYPDQEKAPAAEATDAPWAPALPDELSALGEVASAQATACETCGGDGMVREATFAGVSELHCTTCNGSGEIDQRMGGIATSGIVPCPDCGGQPAEVDATARAVMERVIAEQRQQIADLEAKLDAERTLRAQASAELEREKARERDRRLEADAASRDRLWAIDTLVEALVPLAGYATEEDGRVAGMTNPVSLAMSSVRRADALVKLHRALRR